MALVGLICTLRPMKHHRPDGKDGAAMFTLCKGCGHSLWVEVRSAGAFRFLAHFDDDEGSSTYTEHSPSGRTCGLRLDAALHRAPRARWRDRLSEGTLPPPR